MTTPDQIEEKLSQASEPDWIREMNEHFQKEGWFRPSDLLRLLGDPSEGVEVRTEESTISSLLLKR